MLRAIIRIVDCGAAANVGGPVETRHLTIDFDAPKIEAVLSKKAYFYHVECIGIEVLPTKES